MRWTVTIGSEKYLAQHVFETAEQAEQFAKLALSSMECDSAKMEEYMTADIVCKLERGDLDEHVRDTE